MDEEAALPSQLRLAILRLSRRLRQQSAGDISPSQLSALSSINKRGEVSLGELAEIEQIAPPSMTRVAARLEERGLLDRRVDAADRRVARVAITPAGSEILAAVRSRRDAYLAVGLQALTAEERETLASAIPILERLAERPALEPIHS